MEEALGFFESLSERRFSQIIRCSLRPEQTKDSNRNTLLKFLVSLSDPAWQPKFLDIVMDKMLDLSCNDEESVSICLAQLKWIDWFVEPKMFLEKCLQIMDLLPLANQKEMLGLLPDVISDSDHDFLVSALIEWMDKSKELTVAILSAFSNLHLQGSLLVITYKYLRLLVFTIYAG
jgi:hypothetical protein